MWKPHCWSHGMFPGQGAGRCGAASWKVAVEDLGRCQRRGKNPWGTSKPGGGGHLRRHCQCLGKGRRFVGSPKNLKTEQPLSVPNVASRTSLSTYDRLLSMRNSEACERMLSWSLWPSHDVMTLRYNEKPDVNQGRLAESHQEMALDPLTCEMWKSQFSAYSIPQPSLWGAAGLGSEHWKVERHYGRFVSWNNIQGGNKTRFGYMRLFLCKAQW